MTITIYDHNDEVLIGSKDKRFSQTWGEVYKTSRTLLLTNMKEITTWCNNTLKEECLFEVE